jgi:hypothetical protein
MTMRRMFCTILFAVGYLGSMEAQEVPIPQLSPGSARSFLRERFVDHRKGYVAVITHRSYLDESGTHDDSPLTVVGGYLFDAKSAEQFQKEWNQVLRPFRERGIEWFHAYGCANKEKKFANLNFAERLSLFRQLVDLTRETAHMGFFTELQPAVYDKWRANNPTVNSLVGSKYAACCFQCLLFLRQILGEEKDIGDIHYFFERIGEEKGKGHPLDRERNELLTVIEATPSLIEAVRYGGETRAPKGQFHPLEAADLMVWTYSSFREPVSDFTKISRQVFAKGRLRHRYTTMTAHALSNIARLNNDYRIRDNTYVGKIRTFKFGSD